MSPRTDLDRVKGYFRTRLKNGDILTYSELKSFVSKNKLLVTDNEIKRVPRLFKPLAIRKQFRRSADKFAGIEIPKLGLIQSDIAFWPRRWRRQNDNCYAAFVSVCVATGLQHVFPMKDKTRSSCQQAIENLIFDSPFPVVDTIESDMESALTSKRFATELRQKHGVRLVYLKKGSQAWAAEVAIRRLKEQTSAAMSMQEGIKSRRWVDLIRNVTKHHNRQKSFGTSFRRNAIDKKNFYEFLNERFGVDDSKAVFNVAKVDYRSIDPSIRSKVFKFQVGDRVLISKKADVSLGKVVGFDKPSRTGYSSGQVFVIKAAQLVFDGASRDQALVPVFRLAPADDPDTELQARYYTEELQPALFYDESDSSTE